MILHTDFRDYYDNAIGFGVDEKVHYNRFTKKIDIVFKTQNDLPIHHGMGLLGFCGRILPFIKLHKLDEKFICDLDDSRPKIVEVFHAFSLEAYKEKQEEWKDFSFDFWYQDGRELLKLKQFFFDWAIQSDSVFLEHKVPIWAMNFNTGKEKNGIANPRLKEYLFERIKDSTDAFQEISTYLANILVEQKEIAVVEDKYRIQQHGFDLKDSFRNTKKRKKNQIDEY